MSDGAGFRGIGWFLPETVRGNDFWPTDWNPREETARRRDFLAVERTSRGEPTTIPDEVRSAMALLGDDPFRGARWRHVIDDAAAPSDMEAEAARRALRTAGVLPGEIDLVLVNSLVPDLLHPSNAPAVQQKCELVRAAAWSLDVGCASLQPHLLTAASLIEGGAMRNVLIVFSSAVSRVLDYSTASSPAFGDGAAAAVVGRVPRGSGLVSHWMRTRGEFRDGVVYAPVVDGEAMAEWTSMSGPVRLASFNADATKEAGLRASEFCREACLGALQAAGLSLADVDFFVCNQSLGWFVDACRRGLDLPREKTIDTFGEVANIGAAALLFNLDRARRQGRLKDGDLLLMYSPGAGFTNCAVVYRWSEARLSA